MTTLAIDLLVCQSFLESRWFLPVLLIIAFLVLSGIFYWINQLRTGESGR